MPDSTPPPVLGQPATHASRSAPLCANCKHQYTDDHDWCNHPAAPVSAVTGLPSRACSTMRDPVHHPATACGEAGAWFAPRTPACTTCQGTGQVKWPYCGDVAACPDCQRWPDEEPAPPAEAATPLALRADGCKFAIGQRVALMNGQAGQVCGQTEPRYLVQFDLKHGGRVHWHAQAELEACNGRPGL